MGAKGVRVANDQEDLNNFTRFLLKDMQALEQMLKNEMFETDNIRIGAEQEICLIDEHGRPAPLSMEILARLDKPYFTTELARFNLESNLNPEIFTGDCLSRFEHQLKSMLTECQEASKEFGAVPCLAGILPSIRKFDLSLENLAPIDRYYALIDAITSSRGDYELKIEGVDELNLRNTTALIEACNTSLQVHLQVTPDEFVRKYNIAQAVAAPVLAVATNSPLLFGKRLWNETRIALFQQSIDTRVTGDHLRYSSPRVTFGSSWVEKSILDLYKEDIIRFKTLLLNDNEEDALETLAKGKIPRLKALAIHNSTVYRWNRPCYGISPNGKPHLRIENRILPAGPTVIDEVANASFWFGLMNGMEDAYPDITKQLEFDDAKANFLRAARFGLGSRFQWVNGKKINDIELIDKELLPIAREGLRKANIQSEDIDRYLGVIQSRIDTGVTGARWMLDSYASLTKSTTREEATTAIVSSMSRRQQEGNPVHTWSLASIADIESWEPSSLLVEEFMTTDIFTVNQDDIPEFSAEMMDWQRIRYMPIEDKNGELIGLISLRELLRYFNNLQKEGAKSTKKIKDMMIKNPITIRPEASIVEAMELMTKNKIGCLPVVNKGKLVGVITEMNFINITSSLLKRISARRNNKKK